MQHKMELFSIIYRVLSKQELQFMTGLLSWKSESGVWRAECLANNEIGVRGEKWNRCEM